MARHCTTARLLAALLLALPATSGAAFTDLNVSAFSAGDEHACAISGGAAYCWGSNAFGQIGNGTTVDSPIPVLVAGLPSPVTAISANHSTAEKHSCAVANGSVYCWGANGSRQLGIVTAADSCNGGSANCSRTPLLVSGTTGATGVAAGGFHSCAVVSGGIKCWGANVSGQLGNGVATPGASTATPQTVAGFTDATRVVAGNLHTCALSATNFARCWGDNSLGQLGNSSFAGTNSSSPISTGLSATLEASAGINHTCAVAASGAFCWGSNSSGQISYASPGSFNFPAAVQGLPTGSGVTAVGAGSEHSCAVVSGALRCWGLNSFKQVDTSTSTVVTPVAAARIATGVTAADGGRFHTCALVGTALQCFGRNANGQLGTGYGTTASSAMAAVPFTDGVSAVASGGVHACALRNGQVFCWGFNGNGQLGNGSFFNSATPVAVSGIAGATAVAGGAGAHSCAIVNGGVKCWGANASGQLGNNSTADSAAPVDVILTPGAPNVLLANVTALATGTSHSCAVATYVGVSRVYCWGANLSGQLGDSTQTGPRLVATQTSGASTAGAIAVTAGNNHTCAIVSGNALKCWGSNTAGQLGTNAIGTVIQANFSAGLLSGVTAVAAGSAHTCAVQAGALKCFGLNSSGQLGDGTTTTPFASVIRTPIASGSSAVAGGFGHSCAIVNGGLKCWGDGTKGQLGSGSLASALLPADVPGLLSGVAAVSAGSSHTCAIFGPGLTCFGFGEFGELGSARYANTTTPIPVKTGFGSATTLLTDRSPSEAGQAVTLVATVALTGSNPAPGGTVTFKDGGSPIANCGAAPLVGTGTVRRAICTTTALPAGTRSLTADYSGDANYAASSSPALSQVVQVTTPTAFGFTHQTGITPGSVATSNTITITGINVAVPISISGGQYSVGCTGTFTTASVTVSAGATVCVRHVTPLAIGATTTSTLTVGSASAPFNSTTALTASETLPTMAAGISHTLVVTSTGQVWGWGDNTGGKLGNGNTAVSAVPVRAQGLTNVIAVAAGMAHSLALKSDGTVWAWGLGDQGQLGHDNDPLTDCVVEGQFGTFACATIPRQVSGLDNVVAIAAGWRHSMALKRDGTIWTWGSDFFGQRGLGSDLASVPGRVTATGLFTRISAGYFFSTALRSDGTVWSWGRGAEGELGTASTGTATPTQVLGLARPVNAIATGSAYTLARLDNNSLVAWGANRYGTLGDFTVPTNNGAGVPSFRATPGPVNNLVNVVEFSAGFGFALARRSDGTVWGWGLNNRGQTGLATTSSTCGRNNNRPCVRDPLRILSQDGAIRLAAGGAHAIVVRPGGAIQAFGDNGVGQRGDTTGNFGQPLSPPTVLARFNQSVYDPDGDLTPGGAFGTPAGVGRSSGGGAIDLDDIGTGLSFGPQGLGVPSAPVTITLTNVADAEALAITSIAVAGDAIAGEFSFAANGCSASLPAGQSCTMDLVFTPAAFGDRQGALTIATDAPQSPTITMVLSGLGIDTRAPATVTLGTTASTAALGVPVTLRATVSAGAVAVAGTVSFLDNASPITGCTSVTLSGGIATCTTSALAVGAHPVKAAYSGSGTVQAAESPIVFQTIISVATPAAIPRLGNISTRMQVLTGNDVLIGGFIIGGNDPKTVVVRARGPSLAPFGIANFLANPKLDLFSGQTVIASNDDFGTAPNLAALQATGFAPTSAQESAILATLGPGAYTAIVTGVGNTTGVGIVEVFEVDRPDVPLANISTRGQVLTNNDVMIGGFIIQGDTPQTVIVRARGPSLAPFGIANFLANPVLQLFSGQTVIASNDNWQQAANAAEIQARGFAPSNANEAAILITLTPGAYTAIVTGAGGTTGVGIIEVFAQ